MKRKVFLAAIAICMVAIIAGGTLAYFTGNSTTITNKFMVASNDPKDPDNPTDDEIFGIKVVEDNESDGVKNEAGEYEYKDMIPGKTFKKNPKITNTGAYDQWVRVTVTFSKQGAWKDAGYGRTADGKKDLFTSIVSEGFVSANWVAGTGSPKVSGDNLIYTFFYNEKLTKGSTAKLFTKVTIPTDITVTKMNALDGFTIGIKADAIQADNTAASAKATFESTSPVYWVD